ncbi:DUF7507 domain-containing protein [Kitasatospora griseola]|uniref:DUF7507 domain-containing protein n=1 Tax=Kitasatospora griseola TaxID=2064 RepID=UPI003415293F
MTSPSRRPLRLSSRAARFLTAAATLGLVVTGLAAQPAPHGRVAPGSALSQEDVAGTAAGPRHPTTAAAGAGPRLGSLADRVRAAGAERAGGPVASPVGGQVTAPVAGPVAAAPAAPAVPVAAAPRAVAAAALGLEKAADQPGPYRLGEWVYYTYTVTNTGTEELTGLVVTDDRIATVTCDATTLAPGASTLCHGNYRVFPADVDAGSVTNTAQASARNVDGDVVQSPPAQVTVQVIGDASLKLEKAPYSTGPFDAGDAVTYTYTVTNTGQAPLSNLTVTDDQITTVTCDTTVLDRGQSTLCHGTYVVKEEDVLRGYVTNIAYAHAVDPLGRQVDSNRAAAAIQVFSTPAMRLQKVADSTGPFRLGDSISYTYTVLNTGTAVLSDITVTDDRIATVTCDTTTLARGENTLCHGTYVVTAADVTAGQVTNTGNARSLDPRGGGVVAPPVKVTVPVVGTAELSLAKSADTAGPFQVGDRVAYTYTVTNTGTAAVSNLTVADDHVATVACAATTLDPGGSTTCHGTYVVTAADLTAGSVTNTARAEGTDPLGETAVSPPAEATVPVVGEALLTLQKAAAGAGPFHAGDTVPYTYTVTNTGTAAVTGLTVTDDHIGSVTCDATTLDPGASTFCHGSYVITAADVQAGSVTNTAHANGLDPRGKSVRSPDARATIDISGDAELTIGKVADSAGPFHLGDTVAYTFTVTNADTETLNGLVVSDDHITAVTCDATVLDPGRSTLCHGTYTVTAADVTAGHVTNTAHATATDPQGQTVQSPPAEATVQVLGTAELTLNKTADGTGPFRAGDTVTYTYTVTNTGTAAVNDLTVADNRVAVVACAATTLDPGGSTTCHGEYRVTAADVLAGNVTNRARAEGTDPQGVTVVSAFVEATVPVVGEGRLSMAKAAESAGPFHLGDTVGYTYTVTNTGTALVHSLSVVDDRVASVMCGMSVLEPGRSVVCRGSYVVTAADVAAGRVTNTAHAEGTDTEGVNVASPAVEVTVEVVGEARLSMEKAADGVGPFHVGDTVGYTYTVTNTGTAAIHGLGVVDDRVASVVCQVTALEPGQSTVCRGSYVVTAADVAAGRVTNTAHAEGTDPQGGKVVSPAVEVTVPVVGEAQLSIAQKADAAGPFRAGDTVQYTYTVTNTGPVAVHDLTVSDDHVASVTCDATVLDPGQSVQCHGSYTITEADAEAGHVTNIARADGLDPEGHQVESAPGETTVETTASASSLSITKQADVSGSARAGDTVTYTYTVTNTGTTVLTDVSVSDDRVAQVVCDATALDPGASTTCRGTYVVTEADATAGRVLNTATASARDPQGKPVESRPVSLGVTVSECPGCGRVPHPSSPTHGGRGQLPETGSPAGLATAGLAGGVLLTLGGVLLHWARRRTEADRFVG